MRHRPKIGVTGPDRGGTAAWLFTKLAVMLQGGKAVRIRPSDRSYPDDLDGLILGGGADIDPERYDQHLMGSELPRRPKPKGFRKWMIRIFSLVFFPFIMLIRKLLSTKSRKLDKNRDRLEFRLLEEAMQRGIPILGICRGSQLINVQLGGDLHQEIIDYYTEVPRVNTIWPKKKVRVDPDSRLHRILGTDETWVNALHYQAVDELGEDLRVAAREESGVTQAIEHSSYPFLIGVQWHPEYLPQLSRQRNIFKALVEKAANNREAVS
ncbi:MAG: gamma-glutamyl-gamma-aminobutyrate hydrolase family protein [Balneolaceae bacterium]|nr:gamma-glutamyl-gamma-aminobutyrate hydrolase family protein [Balneolaceae bacterium]